jgi:homogentisate 1,2-dioxygenase
MHRTVWLCFPILAHHGWEKTIAEFTFTLESYYPIPIDYPMPDPAILTTWEAKPFNGVVPGGKSALELSRRSGGKQVIEE